MLTPIVNKLEKVHEHKVRYLYPSMRLHFHDFFKPYDSFKSLTEQVTTPFGMLFLSASSAALRAFEALFHLIIVAPLHLVFGLSPSGALEALVNTRDNFTEAAYYVFSAVVDTCKELITLFTRMGGTLLDSSSRVLSSFAPEASADPSTPSLQT